MAGGYYKNIYYRVDTSTTPRTLYISNERGSGYRAMPEYDPLDVDTQIAAGKNVIIELVNDKFVLSGSIEYMFGLSKTVTFNDMDKGDTSGVTNMRGLFFSCSELTSLDLSNFDTSNVTDMYGMFSMQSNGIMRSKFTELDLSSFNTSKVTNMACMFNGFSGEELNIANFDISNVKTITEMFRDSDNLKKIIVNENTNGVDITGIPSDTRVFSGCTSILNGDGDVTLARANNTTPNGYFGSGRTVGRNYKVYLKV